LRDKDTNADNYFIRPGYIFLPAAQTKISAVLGSSVAVALYDKAMKKGGMTHFLYPEKNEADKPTAIFGDISTRTLIKMLLRKGSRKKYLEAQIFGGAFNNEFSDEDIGKRNILSARKILAGQNIPVTSEDTGGQKGRKIIFDTHTNEIVILKVDKLRKSDWYPYDRRT
jgi:chemotaxis protein CheD